MTPPISPPSDPKTQADTEAGEQSSYVRRTVTPTRESVTLPAAPAARRRFIAQRQW